MCRDYIRRLNLYRERVWSCSRTKASGLTYEEALKSEAKGEVNPEPSPAQVSRGSLACPAAATAQALAVDIGAYTDLSHAHITHLFHSALPFIVDWAAPGHGRAI